MIEQILNEHLGERTPKVVYTIDPVDKEELKKVTGNLRQEIHEEISRANVESYSSLVERIKKLEERIKKLEEDIPKTPEPVHPSSYLTPIKNSIEQIQARQQQIDARLGQIERNSNSPRPPINVPGNNNNISQIQFDEQTKELETLKKKFFAQSQNYEKLKSDYEKLKSTFDGQIQELSRKLEYLNLNKFDEQTKDLEALKKKFSAQSQNYEKLKSDFDEKVQEFSQKLKDLKIKDTGDNGTVKSKSPISFFSLHKPKTFEAFFHGDEAAVKLKLRESIQDMDELITCLKQSQIGEPTRTSFTKDLRACKESFEKLYRKFDFDGMESEEISENITEKFFKIISDNLFDNVMISLYRGFNNSVEYQEFLKKVNQYLSKHRIYTEDIIPGTKLQNDMMSNIEPPIFKHTAKADDDGKVDKVELLPYFMIFEDEDGKPDTVRKRGKVICLKYGA